MKLTSQELARLDAMTPPPAPPPLKGLEAGATRLDQLVRFRRERLG